MTIAFISSLKLGLKLGCSSNLRQALPHSSGSNNDGTGRLAQSCLITKVALSTVLLSTTVLMGLGCRPLLAGPATLSDAPYSTIKLAQRSSSWKRFLPSEGGFSVLMPGTPVPVGASFEVGGISLKQQQYVTAQQNDTVVYMVSWTDLPPNQLSEVSADTSLDNIRDGVAERLNARLLHEFEVQLAGSPGRHFKMRAVINNRVYSVTQRIYLKDSRIYQLTAMAPQRIEFDLTGSISGFLKSFAFVPLRSGAESTP